MFDKEYIDIIEIENKNAENSRLTISGNHVIKFLTYLKVKGIEALGQDAPLFGMDDFPTIYYINFALSSDELISELKEYLKSESISYSEAKDDKGNIKISDFTKGEFN